MNKYETHNYIDTFFSMNDAYEWLEGIKEEYPAEQWEILEERVNLLGGGYRAGITFVKKQKEFNV